MTAPSIQPPVVPTSTQGEMLARLQEKTFFKLIGGGSFTEIPTLQALSQVYAQAGASCIDLACDPLVVQGVAQAVSSTLKGLSGLLQKPAIMVSLPLDPDPHFRKIDLDQEACILCKACLPVCPTEAFILENQILNVSEPLCYGCGRCVPVCPTEALQLQPFLVQDQVKTCLSLPVVDAVEIHTHHADPYMLTQFLQTYQQELKRLILAFCFRPEQVSTENWLACVQQLLEFSPFPIVLQVDGNPMSGSSDPEASLPALSASLQVYELLKNHPLWQQERLYITLSGGINDVTADHLRQPAFQFIAGVGLGTFAKQWVWSLLNKATTHKEAVQKAGSLVQRFQELPKSAIMKSINHFNLGVL